MGCNCGKSADAASPGDAQAPNSPQKAVAQVDPSAPSASSSTNNGNSSSSAAVNAPTSGTDQAASEEAAAAVAPPAGQNEQKSAATAAAPAAPAPAVAKPGAANLKAGLQRLIPRGKTKYDKVVAAAATFIASHVLDKGWAAEHRDVAFSCKAPLAFLMAGYDDYAVQALEVAAAHLNSGGIGSCREFYSVDYPQCPWLWICWAATQLSAKGVNKPSNVALADRCYRQLRSYSHPILATGLLSAPFKKGSPCQADYFATGMLAKVALLREDWEVADHAAEALLRALEANRLAMSEGFFRLRWTWDTGFDEDSSPRSRVQQTAPNQLYFMLGFPAYVLLELASSKPDKARQFRAAAESLLDFLKGCRHLASDPSAHAAAGAFAAAKNKTIATKICDHLASLQKQAGCFRGDAESAETMDEACEISIWLSSAGADLL